MNNKGFAITGILYTIMILFTMTLFAILTGLNTKMKLMQKSTESFNNDYITNSSNIITQTDDAGQQETNNEVETMNTTKTAIYNGKYIFTYTESGNIKYCIKYLSKNKSFNDNSISFIKNDTTCKSKINNLILETVYVFK